MIETLTRLKDTVSKRAEDYLRSIDRVMELYRTDALPADAQYLGQPSPAPEMTEPISLADPPGKAGRAGKQAPARKRTSAPRASSPRSEGSTLFALAAAAVGRLGEPFGAAELAGAVPDLKQLRAADYLSKMAKAGILQRVGFGKYTRLKGRVGPPPEDHPSSESHFALPRREAKPNSLAAAVLEIAARSPEPFSLPSLLPQVLAHPNCRKTGEESLKITAAAFLQELRSRGWLERVGTDRPTAYRRTKQFPTTAGSASGTSDHYGELPGNPSEVEEDEENTIQPR